MEGQGLNHPMERGCVPLLAEWGLGMLVAAGRGCAAWQMVERRHRLRWEHSGRDGIWKGWGGSFGAGGSEGQLSCWM